MSTFSINNTRKPLKLGTSEAEIQEVSADIARKISQAYDLAKGYKEASKIKVKR